jgi:hypothetical protein
MISLFCLASQELERYTQYYTLESIHCLSLRHSTTSWKVAGSIHDEVMGVFNLYNPSSRTMTLGSTQPLTEMSMRNLPGGKGQPARKADNITTICEPIVYKMWDPRRLKTLCSSTACYRNSFIFTFLYYCLRPWYKYPSVSITWRRDNTRILLLVYLMTPSVSISHRMIAW